MKKIFFSLLIIIILLSFLSNLVFINNSKTIKTKIGNQLFNLEVADTEKVRNKGLSNRPSLPNNSGMLFIFDKKNSYTFWMKEMNFPLDFIWVDGTTIKDLTRNIPPPNNPDESDLVLITPKTPINKVIEVNAGTIDKLKLNIGDNIKLPN